MSAHVLLNLLNEPRKSDKILGLPSSLSLFSNKFNKSILLYAIRITLKVHFWRLKVKVLSYCTQRCY